MNPGAGLLGSLQALLDSAAALARARLELFGAELQQELARLFYALAGALVVLLLAALGAAFAASALLLAVAEAHRALAAVLIALFFFGLALAAAFSLRRLGAGRPRPFAASLAELERDRERFATALEPVARRVSSADQVIGTALRVLGWGARLAPVLALLRRR